MFFKFYKFSRKMVLDPTLVKALVNVGSGTYFWSASQRQMVPTPQYASATFSLPVRAAAFLTSL